MITEILKKISEIISAYAGLYAIRGGSAIYREEVGFRRIISVICF